MTPPLSFDTLQSILHQRLEQLPDHRKAGPNTQYRIHDAALGAFGIFFTQSPSFLDYQRTLQQNKGQNATVQVMKRGITLPFAPPDRLREAETVPLHPAGRLHTLR